jgi:hypothetical protein
MDLMMIIIIVVVVGVIIVVGGGVMYWFWIASRPKKMTWNAEIYQLGDGTISPEMRRKGKEGNEEIIRYNGKLGTLVPYTTDIIEKVDKKSGATHYWLQKLKKSTPVVTADCVEVWGQGKKKVKVLLEGDSCTLLKSGYDKTLGEIIFRPMPHDRINMIKTEVEERNARIENTRDILAQITPFVVAGIAMLGLVCIAYFSVQGAIKIAELNTESALTVKEGIDSFKNDLLRAKGCILDEEHDIKTEEPPMIPP